MTVRRSQLAMTAAATALIVDSLLPWYTIRWSSTTYGTGQTIEHSSTASAWTASTGWSLGVVLALVAAAGWLLWPRRLSRRARDISAAVLAAAATLTTAGTWLTVALRSYGPDATLAITPSTTNQPRLGVMVRDALNSGTVSWGCYIGVLLMAAIVWCALAATHLDPWRRSAS
ncbi:hypothetical protein [Actinoplanes sp. NPDC048796]|uniref:hypothetical protein n=1 Tax=Actinoplanes sp. NPDC048796 TaxID=3155640 RepID=UPI0034045E8F